MHAIIRRLCHRYNVFVIYQLWLVHVLFYSGHGLLGCKYSWVIWCKIIWWHSSTFVILLISTSSVGHIWCSFFSVEPFTKNHIYVLIKECFIIKLSRIINIRIFINPMVTRKSYWGYIAFNINIFDFIYFYVVLWCIYEGKGLQPPQDIILSHIHIFDEQI